MFHVELAGEHEEFVMLTEKNMINYSIFKFFVYYFQKFQSISIKMFPSTN